MDLKVGMHAYSKKCRDYGIGKIVNITKRGQGFYGDLVDIQYKYSTHSIKHQEIVASYNIIDLIEVGDYVNGYRVVEVDLNTYENNKKYVKLDFNEEDDDLHYCEMTEKYEEDIKSIVTHEEFDAIKYEVK